MKELRTQRHWLVGSQTTGTFFYVATEEEALDLITDTTHFHPEDPRLICEEQEPCPPRKYSMYGPFETAENFWSYTLGDDPSDY